MATKTNIEIKGIKKSLISLWKNERALPNGDMLSAKEIFAIYKEAHSLRYPHANFFLWLYDELYENAYCQMCDC